MGALRERLDQRMADQAVSRRVNGIPKNAARVRKQARLVALVGQLAFPYTPTIRSWISEAAGKPFSQLDEAAIKALLAAQPAKA